MLETTCLFQIGRTEILLLPISRAHPVSTEMSFGISISFVSLPSTILYLHSNTVIHSITTVFQHNISFSHSLQSYLTRYYPQTTAKCITWLSSPASPP